MKSVYGERYVAFVDILGFSEIIAKSVNEPNRAAALSFVLEQLNAEMSNAAGGDSYDFRAQSFSDSIVLSVESSLLGLRFLLTAATTLSLDLLVNGLLVRGGVSHGQLYHSTTAMFGPAFIEAYKIEKRIARYPRIVLSEKAYNDFEKLPRRPDQDRGMPVVMLDQDGPAYLELFSRFEPFRGPKTAKLEVLAASCVKAIQNLLDRSIHVPSHYEKLSWLANKWNGSVFDEDVAAYGAVVLPILGRSHHYVESR